MAKLAVTCAVIFLLFTFSNARSPLDLTVTDANDNLPESEAKTGVDTILLPSEKPEIDSAPIAESKPTETDGSVVQSLEEIQDHGGNDESVPLTVVTFRPFTHRFPNRPISFHFRHGRPCRHRQIKPNGPRDDSNDMIISDLRDHRFMPNGLRDVSNDMILFDPLFHGEAHQIPERFHQMRPYHGHRHYHHHHHHEDEEEVEEKEDSGEHFRAHYHHRHHHEDGDEHHGGFLRKIRKFLNRF